MRWDIEERASCELWFFSGVNFGGKKRIARVHAYGGLQGDEIPADGVGSLGVIAHPGTRVILKTARTDAAWEDLPWRAISVIEGFTTNLNDGRTCVQVPDLDRFDPPGANRTHFEAQDDFPQVERFEDGEGWTFGRSGRRPLRHRIVSIRVERIREERIPGEHVAP